MAQPVSDDMMKTIRLRLDDIAREENLHVIFAVESGSRAWGFHSPDSDYDVRFVYSRPPEWHYRLGRKRDVVERPIDDELDISGWELSKALTLMLGSNAVVAEWLQSPVVYHADHRAVQALEDFARRVLDRKSITWHYLSLLKRQESRLFGPDGGVRIKRYFYVLRPALALRWMRLHKAAMPPMDMTKLRAGSDLSPEQTRALDQLTEQKMVALERAEAIGRVPVLDDLVTLEVEHAEAWLKSAPKSANAEFWNEANSLHLALSSKDSTLTQT